MTDTTDLLHEPNMLHAHPMYVLAILVVVIVLFVGIRLIRKRTS